MVHFGPFQNFPAPLPEWLPGETLFSLCSRYHLLSGNRLASTTCKALFGHARQGSQHDLPCRLETLFRRSAGVCGDVREIALGRTLLSYYLPMRSADIAVDAIAAMAGDRPGNLKFRLGILTSRFRANHPLKACKTCMSENIAEHGIAYWHLVHQFPGVWTCNEHHELLMQSTVKSSGVGRFLWALPKLSELSALPVTLLLGEQRGKCESSPLHQFADLAQRMGTLPAGEHFDPARLVLTYQLALSEKGLVSKSGRLRLNRLNDSFRQAIMPLKVIPELSNLAPDEKYASASLARWIRTPRGGTHPLRHLAIIFWLFSDWDSFVAMYRCAGAQAETSILSLQQQEILSDPRHELLLGLVRDGNSFSQIAKIVGIDIQTAIAWAAKAGYKATRRPKKLKADIFGDLVNSLRAGQDKIAVALRFSVSISTVTRILRTEIGLQVEWHKARFDTARKRARSAWAIAESSVPIASIKELRNSNPAAYAWLYRNDQDWLNARCQLLSSPPLKPAEQCVDWHSRDLVLSDSVRKVGTDLALLGGARRIFLWQIYQLLPELRAKLSALDRLPLTKAAIGKVTRRRLSTHQKRELF